MRQWSRGVGARLDLVILEALDEAIGEPANPSGQPSKNDETVQENHEI